MRVKIEQERIEEKNKIDEKREKHERREKKEKSGDKKEWNWRKKRWKSREKNAELVHERKDMKRVMLARQPMYLLMPHDYCLSSIASSLPIGVE